MLKPLSMIFMKNNKAVVQSPKDLLDGLHALVAEAEKMVGNSVGEHSAEALASLRERFGVAQERFNEFYSDAREKVVAGAKSTDVAIRTHPYETVAIAAAVGLLVGIVLGRRSS